jgi:anti-sigma factor RsiW
MSLCENIHTQMTFYLDDELDTQERADFEAHLQGCGGCRNLYEQQRRLLTAVREARPLYTAPADLRARIAGLLNGAPPPELAPSPFRRRIRRALRQGARTPLHLQTGSRALALTVVIAAIALAGILFLAPRRDLSRLRWPSEFALMAVDTHLRRLRGQLPLEIVSASADAISAWFAGKVPFSLQLPNYQESSGQEKLYRLEGARLVGLKNDYAAYVAYQMLRRPITLVVTANSVAVPSGGEEIVSRGLRFHCDSTDGFKVITWADRGLTYALVSDLEERGQQSCLVCHTGTRDKDFIEDLRPAR